MRVNVRLSHRCDRAGQAGYAHRRTAAAGGVTHFISV